MSFLNNRQKEIVIALAIYKYKDTWSYYFSNPECRNLLIVLEGSYDIEYKRQALTKYLNKSNNRHSTFGKIIYDEHTSAINRMEGKTDDKISHRFTVAELEYFNDDFKKKVINKLRSVHDLAFSSTELRDMFSNPTLSLQEKWYKLLEYCRFHSNRSKPLFLEFENLIYSHDLDSDHIYYAEKNLEKGKVLEKNGNAATAEYYYNIALEYVNKIKQEVEKRRYVGECNLQLKRYQTAFDDFNHLCELEFDLGQKNYCLEQWMASRAPDPAHLPKSLEYYKQRRSVALDNIFRINEYPKNYEPEEDSGWHSINHFVYSFNWGVIIGFAPGYGLIVLGLKLEPIGLLLAIAGLPIAVAGAAVGGLVGSVHGFFRADTRYPLNLSQQKSLISNLQKIANASTDTKMALIDKIVLEYSAKKTLSSSNASNVLLENLNNSKLDAEEKWQLVAGYMIDKEEKYFKNNGKKLFCIVNTAIQNYLFELETKPNLVTI